jgi:hypothetical protein
MIDAFSQVDVTRSRKLERHGRRWSLGALAMLALNVAGVTAANQATDRATMRQRDGLVEGQRLEGQAILALADAAMGSRRGAAPADFRIRWRNDFLKAQQGTFVPFTLVIDAAGALPDTALIYVRAVPRAPAAGSGSGRRTPDRAVAGRKPSSETGQYPVDAIFPAELKPDGSHVARVSRGFSIAPGDYDVYVVVRERPVVLAPKGQPRAAVLTQPLSVPDFWNGELTTSSVILADRLTTLSGPVTAEELVERPYVIGQNEITPATDDRFRRTEELVVVLLVYNQTVTTEKHFDLQVEYHFFQRVGTGRKAEAASAIPHPPAREGERYFNHTDPQRFNPAIMGAQFDPTAGRPVLAGQGIPLGGFDQGDYRLAIKVTDLLSGKFVTRDVTFTVGS